MAWWTTSLRTHTTGKQLLKGGDKSTHAWCAGRFNGKTRLGSEHLLTCGRYPELFGGRMAIVGKTRDDARDTMILGESGILACAERHGEFVDYRPSRRLLTWRKTGAQAHVHSADAAGRIRGPQFGVSWGDEIGEWDEPEAFVNLELATRLGVFPHIILTFTPKPTDLVIEVLKDPDTAVTRGTSAENAANIAPGKYDRLLRKYGGTRMGRQELDAELLVDLAGAYWTAAMLEPYRLRPEMRRPVFRRIVVAVDPSGSDSEESAETGIIVAAVDYQDPPHAYVLADVSCPSTAGPLEWAQAVRDGWRLHHADRVVAEINYGGALVTANLRSVDRDVPIRTVHARQGKAARAEPVAALYEQGRVHHVGFFPELEQQLTTWRKGTKSPDRLDALVYAMIELVIEDEADDVGDIDAYLGGTA